MKIINSKHSQQSVICAPKVLFSFHFETEMEKLKIEETIFDFQYLFKN